MEETRQFAVVSEERKRKSLNVKRSFSGIEISTVTLSILALIVSSMSFFTSRSATKIAESTYESQFKIVWVSDVRGHVLEFISLDGGQIPQQIIVTTPSEFGANRFELELSDRVYPLTKVKYDLIRKIENGFFVEEGNELLVSLKFPIGIRTMYSSLGENHADHSIYHLNFIARVVLGKAGKTIIKFTGLSFVERQVPKTKTFPILDIHWDMIYMTSWISWNTQFNRRKE